MTRRPTAASHHDTHRRHQLALRSGTLSPSDPIVPDDQARQSVAEEQPEERAGDAEDRRLAQDEPVDLAPGGPGGPQQPDLADPLGQGHRQGVEDQERAHRTGSPRRSARSSPGSRPSRPRSDAVRSARSDRTYGSKVSRWSSAAATPSGVAPGARPTSTQLAPRGPNRVAVDASGMTTVRLSAGRIRAAAGEQADDLERDGSVRPEQGDRAAQGDPQLASQGGRQEGAGVGWAAVGARAGRRTRRQARPADEPKVVDPLV